jgi:hypothetical protein
MGLQDSYIHLQGIFFKLIYPEKKNSFWLNVELPGYFINASNWSTQLSVFRGEE